MEHPLRRFLALCSVAVALPAAAEICTLDDTPAATLLLPYFEVDLGSASGRTTLMSINNAAAEAVLAHVVLWTDLSVPVLDFNLYLTGYDVQTVNLRDVLGGKLPRTASAGQDPDDTISPRGDFSGELDLSSCDEVLPYEQLPPAYVQHVRSVLTGGPSPLTAWEGRCGGLHYGDGLARGYVTVDAVSGCTLRFPGDAGYFAAAGSGDASDRNVLWGDVFYVDSGESSAQGETLVHIEADPLNPETADAGQYTFYGRYVAWTAVDNREPLTSSFATRYALGGGFDGGTDLLVWRDSKQASPGTGWVCADVPLDEPAWYPLGQEQIIVFGEEENPVLPGPCFLSPCLYDEPVLPFPAEAQRVAVGGPSFYTVEDDFGWIFLDLDSQVVPAGENPPEDPGAMQNWVTTVMTAQGSTASRSTPSSSIRAARRRTTRWPRSDERPRFGGSPPAAAGAPNRSFDAPPPLRAGGVPMPPPAR